MRMQSIEWKKRLNTMLLLQSREQAGIGNRCRVEWKKGWKAGFYCGVESRQVHVCGCRVEWQKRLDTRLLLRRREQAGIGNRCRVEWKKGWIAGFYCRVESRQVHVYVDAE